MKTLCAPDLHCWYHGPGSEESRRAEWITCRDHMLNAAKNCDVTLYPGDYWNSNKPSAEQMDAVLETLGMMPSIGFSGNHDVGSPDVKNFVDVCGKYSVNWGITKPCTVYRGNLAVICVPFIKGLNESHIINAVCSELAQAEKRPYTVVMGHCGTDISTYSSGEFALGNEPVFRMAELESLPVDLVVQ